MLMAVIAWVSAAPDANAWTAQELWRTFDYGVEQWDGSANQNSWTINTRKVQLGCGSFNDGTEVLIVKNFLGLFDMYFTVSGNTVKGYNITSKSFSTTSKTSEALPSGQMVRYINIDRIVRADYDEHYAGYYFQGYSIYYDQMVAPYYTQWGYLTNSSLNSIQNSLYSGQKYTHSTEWTGTITTDDYGNTVIDFGPYYNHLNSQAIKVTYLTESKSTIGYDMFDSYRLTLVNKVGTFSDSLNGAYDATAYTLADGEQIGILNFGNYGFAWNNGWENGGSYSEYDLTIGNVEGNKFVIPQQRFMSVVSGSLASGGVSNTNYKTFGYNPDTQERNPNGDITGTIEFDNIGHNPENFWIHTVAGGDVHTYLNGCEIKLAPWGMTDNSTHWTSWGNSIKNTVISYPEYHRDITFDCTLDVVLGDTFAADGKDYVKADIVLTEKDDFCSDYTTYYQVYYLEGEYANAANVPVGEAKLVTTFVCVPGQKSYGITYDLPYPEDYTPTENPTEEQKYTFFVVANYDTPQIAEAQTLAASGRAASGLGATGHALGTVGKPLPTALNGLAVAEAQIKVVSGAVVVEGFDGVVEVYNAQGACVYTGTDSRIELNGGVYIVRAGTKAVKVVIG